MQAGLQPFLEDVSHVLQSRLLPRLHPSSFVALARTCKHLRTWLLDLPPSAWQVGTRSYKHRAACKSNRP